MNSLRKKPTRFGLTDEFADEVNDVAKLLDGRVKPEDLHLLSAWTLSYKPKVDLERYLSEVNPPEEWRDFIVSLPPPKRASLNTAIRLLKGYETLNDFRETAFDDVLHPQRGGIRRPLHPITAAFLKRALRAINKDP